MSDSPKHAAPEVTEFEERVLPEEDHPEFTPEPVQEDDDRYILHSLEPGDTIKALSERYMVQQSAIISANDIEDPNVLIIGGIIKIPK